MVKINKVFAFEILDSRGFPTVETVVTLSDNSEGYDAVPSGASTGTHEALELRDGGARYMGKGVLKAVKNVDAIAKKIIGKPADPRLIDEIMIKLDGTANKTKLGANAVLGVSMAVCRACAASYKMPLYAYLRKAYEIKHKDYLLPAPMLNIINGGKHADSGIDVQEFMIVPVGAKKFSEAIRYSAEVYHNLKKLLAAKGYTVSVGDEGGFAPKISRHNDVLKMIMESIKRAGYSEKNVSLALDSAASEFFQNGKYKFEGKSLSAKEMTGIYAGWLAKYPVISYEDPLAEDDWDGWKYLTDKLGKKCRVIGDDLFVTNPARLERGIKSGTANAILIKLNQIGSVSETIDVIEQAHRAGYSTIISHRSGEMADTFISDLAVAVNAGAIKTGAPCRSERVSKYNQLIWIEKELGSKARYAQRVAFDA
ncbi:MAG: phosphopyruvate hydratase [Elusimicrobia bacterium]|nr:phosphopyruvate hydratase [Elusimicrobiota bacterium]